MANRTIACKGSYRTICVFLLCFSAMIATAGCASTRAQVESTPAVAQPSPTIQPGAQETDLLQSPVSPLPAGDSSAGQDLAAWTPVTHYSYEIVATYPHDPTAWTQGLVYADGIFYEGTGLVGQSTLRRVEPWTGEVLSGVRLSDELFGEGITVLNDKIYALTWKAQTGFVVDKESFELLDTFSYPTEGWGLTHDGKRLIMSDGTNRLFFRDPETLAQTGVIEVFDGEEPIVWLNELEYVDGQIYANVWQTDRIAIIDPDSGQVSGWIDLSGLLDPEELSQPVDVLNGIAYDDEADRLFVTGKLWPTLFEIRLIPID